MSTTTLPSKPGAAIAYELIEGDPNSDLLLVFVNGLGLPQAAWKPTIDLFRQSDFAPKPRLLTYDRFGQGGSARDPRENDPLKDPGYAHDLDDVTEDLHELIETLSPNRHDRIVFVNNSIGANISRRYADKHPGTVEGILFLDSNPATLDFANVWPNPASPAFNLEQMIPTGTTLEAYTAAYTKVSTIFAATAQNKEGFDRRNTKSILPNPASPKLRGSKTTDKGPWITVVSHELETFSRQEQMMMQVPEGMAARYTQPAWDEYNCGLCRLTDADRVKGPVVAPGAGHFVQKDNPTFVAGELVELLRKVEGQQ